MTAAERLERVIGFRPTRFFASQDEFIATEWLCRSKYPILMDNLSCMPTENLLGFFVVARRLLLGREHWFENDAGKDSTWIDDELCDDPLILCSYDMHALGELDACFSVAIVRDLELFPDAPAPTNGFGF